MSQQQGIVKGDALQKLGSLGFIIGAIILIVANLLLPRATDPSNVQNTLTTWGNKAGLVQLAGFLIAVGNWAFMIGSAGVYRSITAGGAAWARLGFYGIIVGTTLNTISSGLLMTTASTAADWITASAADKATAFGVASALFQVGGVTFTMYILVECLAIFFLGIGIARSVVYPKWLGWTGLILGILMVAIVGIPQFFAGQGNTVQMLFAVLAGLSTIWGLALGIWVARKAW